MRIFFYIAKELIPQFLTSICVLSAILVVSQLVRLSQVLVNFGLSLENIMLPFLFIVLPFMSFTIPIAYMFAVLIAFSRLSSDGEVTALLAAGFSVSRAALPVVLIGGFLYITSALCAVHFEPWGRRELVQFYHRKAQTELDNMVRYRLQPGVFVDNFLGYVIYSEEVSKDKTELKNILMAPGASQAGSQDFSLLAPTGKILGSVEQGNLKMIFENGVIFSHQPGKSDETVLKFEHAKIDLVRIFQDQIFGPDEAKDDYRSYPPDKLWSFIQGLKTKNTKTAKETYFKANFLFHQRIANSFAVLVFALFAMVYSIKDQRGTKGGAWAQVILTIVLSYILVMGFKWVAENWGVPGALAAWTPNVILLLLGMFALHQKNRLPPSESILDWNNMPWRKRFP